MESTRPILFFDGVCHLCQASVQWVLRRDRKGLIRFASLQSKLAREVLRDKDLPNNPDPESVVLLYQGQIFTHSAAALKVAGLLGFPWSMLRVFQIVPGFILDALYRLIARNRYRWFGKSESCWLPHPRWEDRFPPEGLSLPEE